MNTTSPSQSPRAVRLSVISLLLLAAVAVALYALPVPGAGTLAEQGGWRGWIGHNMAPIMFATLVVMLLLGYPVAFALAANGLLFGLIGIELGLFRPDLFQALPERVYGTMNNDVLLAVPFFTFLGLVLERSGMAEDLLDTIGQLFGSIRGGLAYAVIFVGALLAATTGVVAASVISMGLISLPIMLRYGYDRRLASGIIAASGTLAQIIPPSLVLIVMADQLGRSVGDMYEAAFIPGLLLAGLYALYVFTVSILFPHMAPGLPPEAIAYREPNGARGVWQLGLLSVFSGGVAYWVMGRTSVSSGADYAVLLLSVAVLVAFLAAAFNRTFAQRLTFQVVVTAALTVGAVWLTLNHWTTPALLGDAVAAGALYALAVALVERASGLRLISRMAEQATFVMVPPLALIFLVLGTIFIGLATPTEGGAMGAVGALALAAMKKRLTFDMVRQATYSTAKLAAFVLFILIGARVFSLTFYGVNGHIWVEELMVSLPGGQMGFLIAVSAMVFLLAFFLDFFELAFIIIPLLAPAADRLGIDLVWFGIILAVNMQTSFMHPPFGFSLFFLRSVAPKLPYIDRVTKKETAPVLTSQIYWGAVPFVLIQLVMVGLVIAFPQMVMHYKSTAAKLDDKQIEEQFQGLGTNLDDSLPPLEFK